MLSPVNLKLANMNFAPINKTKHRLLSLSLTREFGLRLANGQPLSKIIVKTNKLSFFWVFYIKSDDQKAIYFNYFSFPPCRNAFFLYYDL